MEQIKPPPSDILSATLDLLEERDIYVREEHAELFCAAVLHVLTRYRLGHDFMFKSFNLKTVRGDTTRDYTLRDHRNAKTQKLDPSVLVFLYGCISKDKVINLDNLEVKEKQKTTCESCGSLVVCSHDHGGQDLCTVCLSNQEDPSAKEKVTVDCFSCSHVTCSWNPARKEAICE